MKVLFVCRNNTARSQEAMEFYRRLTGDPASADSAGTKVEGPEKYLRERPGATIIVEAMREYGIDMSDNERKHVTQEILAHYDHIFIMAEPPTVPDWLAGNPKVEWWTVADPKGQPIEVAREVRDEILVKVGGLLGNSDKNELIECIKSKRHL